MSLAGSRVCRPSPQKIKALVIKAFIFYLNRKVELPELLILFNYELNPGLRFIYTAIKLKRFIANIFYLSEIFVYWI